MAEKKEIKLTGRQVLQAYEMEQAKFREIGGRKQTLQQLLAETMGAEDSLKELEKSGKNRKILVAIGAGIYAEAKLESTKEVKTGLGGGILKSAPLEKALKELATRQVEIRKDLDVVLKDEGMVLQNLNNLGYSIEQARRKKAQENKE